MTPDESLTFGIFQLALHNLVTRGWLATPFSGQHLHDHFDDALRVCSGKILPLEAHLLWWSMTDGLSTLEFENVPNRNFSECVEMITDSLYWLIDETHDGTEFLKSLTAKEGWDERLKYLNGFPAKTGALLGEFDTQTPNLPQIGPAQTVAQSMSSYFKMTSKSPGIFAPPPIVLSPTQLAQLNKIMATPTSFVTPRCECGAVATGSPAHSSWCPVRSP